MLISKVFPSAWEPFKPEPWDEPRGLSDGEIFSNIWHGMTWWWRIAVFGNGIFAILILSGIWLITFAPSSYVHEKGQAQSKRETNRGLALVGWGIVVWVITKGILWMME